MSTGFAMAALSTALVFVSFPSAHAQVKEVVVRQGDTIEWHGVSGPPHRVRFGGTVGKEKLTPVGEIRAILDDFKPALPDNGEPAPSGKVLLTATVRKDAPLNATFIFTCGNHPTAMLSIAFRVVAAGPVTQTHRIEGVTGFHWQLRTEKGEVIHIDTTP